jgi:hypothetical protein
VQNGGRRYSATTRPPWPRRTCSGVTSRCGLDPMTGWFSDGHAGRVTSSTAVASATVPVRPTTSNRGSAPKRSVAATWVSIPASGLPAGRLHDPGPLRHPAGGLVVAALQLGTHRQDLGSIPGLPYVTSLDESSRGWFLGPVPGPRRERLRTGFRSPTCAVERSGAPELAGAGRRAQRRAPRFRPRPVPPARPSAHR